MGEEQPQRIEYFRIDRSPRTRGLLAFGAVSVTLGMSGIATHFIHRIPRAIASGTTFTGGLLLVLGLVTAFGSMALTVFENHYVEVRLDGIVLHRNEIEQVVPWANISEIGVDGAALAIRLTAGGEIRWLMGGDVENLAAHLEEQRKKAIHGLLRASRPPPRR